jgi:hypothetical protein
VVLILSIASLNYQYKNKIKHYLHSGDAVSEPLARHQLFSWFSCYFSVPPGKYRDSTLHQATTASFYIPSPIKYSSLDTIQTELLRKFLNKRQNLIYLHQHAMTLRTQPPTSVFTPPPTHKPIQQTIPVPTPSTRARETALRVLFHENCGTPKKAHCTVFVWQTRLKNAVVMFIAEIYRKRCDVVTLRNKKKKHDNCLVRKTFL